MRNVRCSPHIYVFTCASGVSSGRSVPAGSQDSGDGVSMVAGCLPSEARSLSAGQYQPCMHTRDRWASGGRPGNNMELIGSLHLTIQPRRHDNAKRQAWALPSKPYDYPTRALGRSRCPENAPTTSMSPSGLHAPPSLAPKQCLAVMQPRKAYYKPLRSPLPHRAAYQWSYRPS